MTHKPKKFKDSYAWQSTSGPANKPHLVNSYIFDLFIGGFLVDALGGYRYYETEEEALQELATIVAIIRKDLSEYEV